MAKAKSVTGLPKAPTGTPKDSYVDTPFTPGNSSVPSGAKASTQVPDKSKLMSNKAIEGKAIAIVKDEKIRWEMASAFVTNRVSFKMRQLIRILRKNYFGFFDEEKDPNTGLQKIWYPLTEINVEAAIKNIDLDQKDIGFRAKTPNGYELTHITRAAVQDKLNKIYFEQKLNDLERYLAIDGTAVWKTFEENGKMIVQPVDLLNVYIDPTSPSIQEAYRFTERNLMFPDAIMGMDGWINTKDIDENVSIGIPRTDPYWLNQSSMINSNVKMIDVWECWGMIPKSLITGLEEDSTREVPGHLVVSGLDSPGKERCHLIEINDKRDAENNSLKPYEEVWYTKVPNRWYGKGIAEKGLQLQVYANIVFNIRINRSRVSQLGLFKAKKGAGITPQMLSSLPANGVIVLNNMDDLEQFVVQEASPASYKDEDVVNTLMERLTNAFEVVTGEALPASTPATNAVIQNQNAKSGFSMIKSNIGEFLRRWMDRHALPIIAKELTTDALVRITAGDEDFKVLVDRIVLNNTMTALDDHYARGYLPTQAEIADAMASAKEKMLKGDLFIKLARNVIASELETDVYVTNDEMDISVTIQNLISMLNFAPEYKDAIVKQTFDLMGLSMPTPAAQQAVPNGAPAAGMPQPGSQPMPMPASMGVPNSSGVPMPQPGTMAAPQGQQAQRIATHAITGR